MSETTTTEAAQSEYEFKVIDASGLWGCVRIAARSAAEAESVIRADFSESEVEPHGSLLPEFQLELIREY